MNKRRLIPAALWVTAISPLFFASCVDDSYDLSKDIDMTVTIGGNTRRNALPGRESGTKEHETKKKYLMYSPKNQNIVWLSLSVPPRHNMAAKLLICTQLSTESVPLFLIFNPNRSLDFAMVCAFMPAVSVYRY